MIVMIDTHSQAEVLQSGPQACTDAWMSSQKLHLIGLSHFDREISS